MDKFGGLCVDCSIHRELQHGVWDRLLQIYAVIGELMGVLFAGGGGGVGGTKELDKELLRKGKLGVE